MLSSLTPDASLKESSSSELSHALSSPDESCGDQQPCQHLSTSAHVMDIRDDAS